MKNLVLVVATFLIGMSINAQTLPKPSPLGSSSQLVGVTSISFEYSRPSVKEREIFGALIPFGELWRFGANSATKITIDTELNFAEGVLPAGSYAVFAIPREGVWEIIFNKDTEQGGTADYDEKKDALRLAVEPMENSFTETFTLGVNKIRNEEAVIVMLWENVRIELPFTVATNEYAIKNIEAAVNEKEGKDLANVYQNAANFYYSSLKDYDMALVYADKAISMGENYRNLFMKARIMKEVGGKSEAMKLAQTALAYAEKEEAKGYADFIARTLETWKKEK